MVGDRAWGLVVGLGGALVAGCHSAPRRPDVAVAQDWSSIPCDTPARSPVPRSRGGALSPAERDSLLLDVQTHRAAWRARRITEYRIRVAVGCFCPWLSTPAVLEVRNGIAVALRDTTGRPAGPVREPWSIYTVEGLFDAVERAARSADVVEVDYNACLGYPSGIRGDAKRGQVDDWFWVRAGPVTLRR